MMIDKRKAAPDQVLYIYHCTAYGHHAKLYFPDDSHDGEPAVCMACGAPVWIEWDGGVTFHRPGGSAA